MLIVLLVIAVLCTALVVMVRSQMNAANAFMQDEQNYYTAESAALVLREMFIKDKNTERVTTFNPFGDEKKATVEYEETGNTLKITATCGARIVETSVTFGSGGGYTYEEIDKKIGELTIEEGKLLSNNYTQIMSNQNAPNPPYSNPHTGDIFGYNLNLDGITQNGGLVYLYNNANLKNITLQESRLFAKNSSSFENLTFNKSEIFLLGTNFTFNEKLVLENSKLYVSGVNSLIFNSNDITLIDSEIIVFGAVNNFNNINPRIKIPPSKNFSFVFAVENDNSLEGNWFDKNSEGYYQNLKGEDGRPLLDKKENGDVTEKHIEQLGNGGPPSDPVAGPLQGR